MQQLSALEKGLVQYKPSVRNASYSKSREISYDHNLFLSYSFVLKFCREHGSITAVLCAKFQNDTTKETNIMDERDFARFAATISTSICFIHVTTTLASEEEIYWHPLFLWMTVTWIKNRVPVGLYITVTSQGVRWRDKSPASRLFIQPFVQAQIKENIKAPRHWPLWGEFTGHRWIPLT